MDPVLGLSMTSSSVRWVLVEGAAGDGATLDRGCRLVDGLDADGLLDDLLSRAAPGRIHAVGLTWSAAAEAAASRIWQGLTDRGIENVIAVSDIEAAETLAVGIAEMAECDRAVVCVAEPDALLLATVSADGVLAERVGPDGFADDVDAVAPDAVFVLGSGDVPAVMTEIQQRTDVAVISADQADLALARGAALASTAAVALLDTRESPIKTKVSVPAVLTSVLGAAVVTLVVSVSAAVGLSLTPSAPQMARSVQDPVPEAAPPPARVLPPKPAAPPPPPPAAPVVEAPVPEAPAPEAPPVYDQPAPEQVAPQPEYVPPPDVFAPAPGAPVLVPPGGPLPGAVSPPVTVEAQQPRLRDRIIERIPIINRFHEPQYDYTP